jgi:hypothetical protein
MSMTLSNGPLRRLIRGLGFGEDLPRANTTPAAPMPSAAVREQRGAPRHNVERDILIRRRGELPAPGRLMNISETGAAVRIRPPTQPATGLWPYYLSNGDDVWLTALIDDPVTCWVIAVDHDVLRLRFAHDSAIRPQIRALIQGRDVPKTQQS